MSHKIAKISNPQTVPTRADLVVVVVALALPSFATWIYFFQAESATAQTQLIVYNVVKAVQFLLPIAWVVGVQRQAVSLPQGTPQGIGLGLLFGATVGGAMLGLYWGVLSDSALLVAATDEIQRKISGFGIDSRLKYVGLGLFYSLIHSFLEEYYWRWFVFGQLRRLTSLRAAIAISSVGFMAHHVLVLGRFFGFDHWATWLFSSSVALGGVVWAWLYHATGSLLPPWLSHLLVDAAIFGVGYHLASENLT